LQSCRLIFLRLRQKDTAQSRCIYKIEKAGSQADPAFWGTLAPLQAPVRFIKNRLCAARQFQRHPQNASVVGWLGSFCKVGALYRTSIKLAAFFLAMNMPSFGMP
jgi:hypothetical protein